MLYIPRKSKYNEQILLENLKKYFTGCFDKVVPIHRRPGYHLQHHYRLQCSTQTIRPTLCRITYVETERWESYRFHHFRVEITSNGRDWTVF